MFALCFSIVRYWYRWIRGENNVNRLKSPLPRVFGWLTAIFLAHCVSDYIPGYLRPELVKYFLWKSQEVPEHFMTAVVCQLGRLAQKSAKQSIWRCFSRIRRVFREACTQGEAHARKYARAPPPEIRQRVCLKARNSFPTIETSHCVPNTKTMPFSCLTGLLGATAPRVRPAPRLDLGAGCSGMVVHSVHAPRRIATTICDSILAG